MILLGYSVVVLDCGEPAALGLWVSALHLLQQLLSSEIGNRDFKPDQQLFAMKLASKDRWAKKNIYCKTHHVTLQVPS